MNNLPYTDSKGAVWVDKVMSKKIKDYDEEVNAVYRQILTHQGGQVWFDGKWLTITEGSQKANGLYEYHSSVQNDRSDRTLLMTGNYVVITHCRKLKTH